MVNVSTVTATWTGFTGAPGYSLFRFAELDTSTKLNAAGAAVRLFLVTLNSYMLPTWQISISPLVQHHEIGTGDLQGESTMSSTPPVIPGTGTAGTVYAGGSGAVINWTTGATHGGRKVRGRTFLVPLLSNAFATDGTVSSGFVTAVTAGGNSLIGDSSTEFGVYSRYWDDAKPPNQTGGGFTPANGCAVPDRSAQLRTRRT